MPPSAGAGPTQPSPWSSQASRSEKVSKLGAVTAAAHPPTSPPLPPWVTTAAANPAARAAHRTIDQSWPGSYEGVYAFYAHLQKGSVVVEPGDEVERGDKLGLLGNSGNTSAPHLHFHLMTGPEALGSDGIPYVIDSFGYEGQVPAREFAESEDLTEEFDDDRLPEPEPCEDELPLNLAIVSFPGE
jgi:murein DD-endopeptidase MepM/ murein hydrolase activator NlpD